MESGTDEAIGIQELRGIKCAVGKSELVDQVIGIDGIFSSDLEPDPVDKTEFALPAGAANDGNQFVFVADDHRWQYTMSLANFTARGTYSVTMVSGNAAEYVIEPMCEGVFVVD